MQRDVFGLVGTTIDARYRVDAPVGEGTFGVVHRGWHLSFDHPIAIKCLKVPPHFTPEAQRSFLESFRNEGKLLSVLSGRNLGVVRVFDFGVTTSRHGAPVPYLILEWLVGRDLEVLLNERMRDGCGPFSEREAIALLRPAIEALASAHLSTPSIAHRDIKPANLFVVNHGPSASLKVLDFGIAKAMQEGETTTQLTLRATSAFAAFTPAYGAPEQFQPGPQGFGRTGPWTDVYALGLILVELVTGKQALEGTSMFTLGVSSTSPTRPSPRARAAPGTVSDAFESVCLRALALKTADRYRHAGELLEALDVLAQVKRPPRGHGATSALLGRVRALHAVALGLVAACAVLGIMSFSKESLAPPEGKASPGPEPAPQEAPAPPVRVEVEVRTSVESGELYLDGESYGTAPAGAWNLELPPGPHQLEVRKDGRSLTASSVMIREGVPAVVVLDPPEPPPEPQLSPAKVPKAPLSGRLTPQQFSTVLQNNKSQLQRCYETALRATGGKQEGAIQLDVNVVVATGGGTKSVSLKGDGLGNMTECVRNSLLRWRFPAAGATSEFAFPLVFMPGKEPG